MTLMPGATMRLLPENNTQERLPRPTVAILHTAVDSPGPTDLARYFARKDVGAESHFWITNNGEIVQMMDTNVVANANRLADRFAVSIETEDDGDPVRNPWTPAQLDAIRRVLLWLNDEHGIPLKMCTGWNTPGIGWHSMWGFKDPIAQTGHQENPWSYFRGKTCPGKTRIAQLLDLVPTLTTRQEDDMTARIIAAYIAGGRDRTQISWEEVCVWVDEIGRNNDPDGTLAYITWAVSQ